MSQRSHVRMALTLAAALGLAACGSKGSTGPSFSNTISSADAASVGGNAASFAGDLASTFDFGTGPSIGLAASISPRALGLLNGAWQATGARGTPFRVRGVMGAPPVMPISASGCNGGHFTVVSGDTTDSDHDGIPNNATVTISCDTTTSNGVTLSEHGTVHIQDISALYGYQFSVNLTIVESHADTSLTLSETGFDNATFTAASASDNLSFTISDVSKIGANSTGGAVHENWDATFTPSGASLAVGSPLPDGNIAFNGGFYVTNAATSTQNFNFNILTTSPLHYVASCKAANNDPVFDSGVIQGQFNGSATVGFTATFTACNTAPNVVGTGNAT